jgi:hypothetical protein
VNARQVPGPFQEELLGSVAALAASIECAPAPPVADEDTAEDDGEAKKDRTDKPDKGKKGKKGKDKKGKGDH